MSHRFFLENPIHDGTASLEGEQAHHAIHVMRFQIGDTITVFDGQGSQHLATINRINKKQLDLTIQSSSQTPPPFPFQISIATALPKGDRQKFLIEKLVELGVTRLVPLKTSRSIAVVNSNVIARLERTVIEASKQCGRNELMKISPQCSVSQLIQYFPTSATQVGYVADPLASVDVAAAISLKAQSLFVAIGPEGGFDETETDLFSAAQWRAVRLSPNILRIETAAVAAAAIIAATRSNSG